MSGRPQYAALRLADQSHHRARRVSEVTERREARHSHRVAHSLAAGGIDATGADELALVSP